MVGVGINGTQPEEILVPGVLGTAPTSHLLTQTSSSRACSRPIRMSLLGKGPPSEGDGYERRSENSVDHER